MSNINQLLASKVASRARAKDIAAQRAVLLAEQREAKEAAKLSSEEKAQIALELLNQDHPFLSQKYLYGSNGLGLPKDLPATAGVIDVQYISRDTLVGRAYLAATEQFKIALKDLTEAKEAYIKHLIDNDQGHLLTVNMGKLTRRLSDSE